MVSAHFQKALRIQPVLLLCSSSTAHSWYGFCAHSSLTNEAYFLFLPAHKTLEACAHDHLPSSSPPALSMCMHATSHIDEKRLIVGLVDHSLASVHVSTDYAVIRYQSFVVFCFVCDLHAQTVIIRHAYVHASTAMVHTDLHACRALGTLA